MKSIFLFLLLLLSVTICGWSQGRNAPLAKEAHQGFGYYPGGYYRAYLNILRTSGLRLPAGNSISVMGKVRRPGEIRYGGGITASKAIADAGGIARFGDWRHVGIWKDRDGQFLILNLKAFEEKKPGAEDPLLEEGDIVIVLEKRLQF